MINEDASTASIDSGFHPVWTLQEAGHYTARSRDVTIGHVVAVPDGSFVAFDGTATPLGRYHTFTAAQRSALRATELFEVPAGLRQIDVVFAVLIGMNALVLLMAGIVLSVNA